MESAFGGSSWMFVHMECRFVQDSRTFHSFPGLYLHINVNLFDGNSFCCIYDKIFGYVLPRRKYCFKRRVEGHNFGCLVIR